MMNFVQRHINTITLLITSGLLACVSIFIGYKNAKIDMLFSDAISDNNLLQAPFIAHDIEIQAIHPHLLKWPVVLVENMIGFNVTTHIVVSILLLLVMNLWLGYLLYKFSRKNILTTSIGLIALASIELLTGLSANEGTLSMLTIRNIELPMTVWLLMVLLRQTKIFHIRTLLASLLLAIIFVSDQLILYTTVVGAVIYLIWSSLSTKNYTWKKLENKPLYLAVIGAVVLAKIITKLFSILGIANFYERSSEHLLYAQSFKALFDNGLAYIGKIFDVFGAGFFNQQIFDGPIYALNIIIVIFSAYLIFVFTKQTKKARKLDIEQKTLMFLLASYFFAMLIFTVVIPRELGGRYFAFLPVIGLLAFSYAFRSFKLKISLRSTIVILVALGCIGAYFVYMQSGAARLYYNQKYDSINQKLGDTKKLVQYLVDNSASVYIDQDYWRNHIIKQQYDQKTGHSLAIPAVYCGGTLVDKQFSRKSWAQENGSNVAIRVKECKKTEIATTFGAPQKIITLGDNDYLYIYNSDIRNVLNLKEYEPDFIKP